MFKFFARFASPAPGDSLAGALTLLDQGDCAAAAEALTRLLDDEPDRSRAAVLLNKRGVAKIRADDRLGAQSDFEAALAHNPRHAPAMVNLGNLCLEAGQTAEALRAYEAAIAADDQYALAHYNAGIAYKRLGRFEAAVRALRTAQKLEGRTRGNPSRRI